jgi:hypothetical protein
MLAKIPEFASRDSRRKRLLLKLLQLQVNGLRSVLLRSVPEPIEITVLADRQPKLLFRTNDGMRAIGYVIAAAISLLSQETRALSGLYLPDEIFELDQTLKRMRQIAGANLELSLRSEAPAAAARL